MLDWDWKFVIDEKEEIYLHNDGSGLGFGIVGGPATGIVVKTILPDGAAGRSGKLNTGDYILEINGQDLTNHGSEYAAGLLRNAGSDVNLLVARGVRFLQDIRPKDTSENSETALTQEAFGREFIVTLTKSLTHGLGVHISGYVSQAGDKSGIYVKDITQGSPAEEDGRIEVDDLILAVDGKRLDRKNITAEEALEILKMTGQTVELTLKRREHRTEADERENTEPEQDEEITEKLTQLQETWEQILGETYSIIVSIELFFVLTIKFMQATNVMSKKIINI